MCMNLLGTLAEAKLPFTIVDKALVDRLRVLDAVGCVKALIPAVHVDCDNCARQDPAIVIEVTARGRKMLSRHTGRQAKDFDRADEQIFHRRDPDESRNAPPRRAGLAADIRPVPLRSHRRSD